MDKKAFITLTSDITSAYVANNQVEADKVGGLVTSIHDALSSLGQQEAIDEAPEPAVSVRSSVKKDHLVCLVCGEKMKMLRRHLRVQHDMEPEEYRAAYNLSEDYPLIAASYSEQRSKLAKEIGLGKQATTKRGRKAGSKNGKSSKKGK